MRSNFNGIIKEIMEQYPNVDLAGYLADNLQLPADKAEVLAARHGLRSRSSKKFRVAKK